VIGFGFEAFVFAYLGLSFFSYADTENYAWSWQFILVEAFICIVARFIGTIGLLYLCVLLRHKPQVTFRQVLFICYAGVIRGAIAFGLVLQLDENLVSDPGTRSLITTTALTLVVSTTVIFGSFMPLVQKYLVPPVEKEAHEYDELDAAEEAGSMETAGFERKTNPKEGHIGEGKGLKGPEVLINKSNNAGHPEHEAFLHPNAMKDSEYDQSHDGRHLTKSQYVKMRRQKFNSCAQCFKRFDDLIMRPWLIYDYHKELLKKKDEFMNMFMKEGDMWEKLYMKEQYDPEEIDVVRSQRGNSVFRHIETMAARRTSQHIVNFRSSGISITSKTGPIKTTAGPNSPGTSHRVFSPP
jgi:Sodium/hydrogen exchanger family